MMEINILNEKKFVKKCLNDPLQPSEIWYTINTKWWKKWKRYVNYNNSEQSVIEHESPGPVDNADLLENDLFNSNCLVEFDYEIVPEPVWKMMIDNYGVMQTDTSLFKRHVIEESNELRVELYPLKLHIYIYGDSCESTPIVKQFSCMEKIEDVEKYVESVCNIPEGSVYQLIQEFDNGTLHVIHYASETTTLTEAGFRREQKLFVDVRNSEGEFSFKDNRASYNSQGSVRGGSSSLVVSHSPISSSTISKTDEAGDAECAHFQPGVCGLGNLGNTCFMNSAIQCISNVPVITKYFLGNTWMNDLNKQNPLGMQGRIAKAYANLIAEMWSGKSAYSMPRDFKYEVAQFAPQFCGYSQHDSQELMMFLLDGLHEDLNRVTDKPYIEQKNCASQPDQTVADDNWQYHLKRNDSIIVDYFHGQLKSKVVCPDCQFVSVTFDPFACLSLPLRHSYQQAVVFCPIDPRVPLSHLSVSSYKNSTVKTLTDSVLRHLEFKTTNELVVAQVRSLKVERFLNDDDPLSCIHPDDQVFMYEVTPLQPDHLYIDVVFKEKDSASNGPCPPLLIQVHHRLTWQRFLCAIRPHLPRFLSAEEVEAACLAAADDFLFVTPQDEEATDGSDCDRNESIITSPGNPFEDLFSVLLVEAAGAHELNPLSRGRRLRGRQHLAIEWAGPVSRGYDMPLVTVPVAMETGGSPPSVLDCLQAFLGEEFLGDRDLWFCPHCKRDKPASKKLDIWRLPRVLVLHLKRFRASTYFGDKINGEVLFPVRGLDLSGYACSSTGDLIYDLVAVSNHVGGVGGGHYFAYAKNVLDGRWYKFDDSTTTVVSEDDIVTRSAYVLVYVSRGCADSPPPSDDYMDVDPEEPRSI